jgi:hypothetical protein
VENFLLDMREGVNEAAVQGLMEPRLERFIGVIYRPETERWSHYAQAVLPKQFDAWVWFDETKAVTPLPTEQEAGEEEMYPVRALTLRRRRRRLPRSARWMNGASTEAPPQILPRARCGRPRGP